MKNKIFTGILMLSLALISTAQIVVNRNNFGNLNWANVIEAYDTTSLNLLSPGNSGANITWNLSALSNDYRDTMEFRNPTGYSCWEDFPTATLVVHTPEVNMYIKDENTAISIIGVCTEIYPPDSSAIKYNSGQKRMTFPTTYNTSFNGQSRAVIDFPYNQPPLDSMRIVKNINYTSIIDGWGTVTIPTGTYPCLRQKYTSYDVDSFYVHVIGVGWQPSGSPNRDTTIEYNWWSANNPFIANITTDWHGVVSSAKYLVYSNLGIHNTQTPSPSDGKFTITAIGCSFYSVRIINLAGETVYSRDFKNGQYTTIADLSDLPKGLYFVKINDDNNISLQKIIIQ
jgi:hypothetical protein